MLCSWCWSWGHTWTVVLLCSTLEGMLIIEGLVVRMGSGRQGHGAVRLSNHPQAALMDCLLCVPHSYSYMIDNVILLITGTLHQRSIAELVPKCHPLGSFEQMEAVNIAQTPAELYNAILVDTPLGEPLWWGRGCSWAVAISGSASGWGLRDPQGRPWARK